MSRHHGLGHLSVFNKMRQVPFKDAVKLFGQHMKWSFSPQGSSEIASQMKKMAQLIKQGKFADALKFAKEAPSGIDDDQTTEQIKKLMDKLKDERRGQAEEMKAILEEQGESQYFVHPYSGHVYAVTGRYPYRIADLLPSLWSALSGPIAPAYLLSGGISGATGLAYTTYDAWGKPVYGMPVQAYKESESEAFMQSMEQQEAPYARYLAPEGATDYPGTHKGYTPRYLIDKPPTFVEGLLGAEKGYSIWKLDSVLTGHWWAAHYGIPYYDKKGQLKMAIGRHQWEAEDQFRKLLQAGVVAAPYLGEVNPTLYGFDMAERMG